MIVVANAPNAVLFNTSSPVATGSIDWYCSWDINPIPAGAGPSVDYLNGTSLGGPTVITGPLPPATAFVIKEITIWNNDSIDNTISILVQPPVAGFVIFQCILPPGYFLRYNNTPGDNKGWQVSAPFGN